MKYIQYIANKIDDFKEREYVLPDRICSARQESAERT